MKLGGTQGNGHTDKKQAPIKRGLPYCKITT